MDDSDVVIHDDKDLEMWKAGWDGKNKSIPASVHNYMLGKLKARIENLEKLVNISSSCRR